MGIKKYFEFHRWDDATDAYPSMSSKLTLATIQNLGEDKFKQSEYFFTKFHDCLEELDGTNFSAIAKNRRGIYNDCSEDIGKALSPMGGFKVVRDNKQLVLENIDVYSSISGYVDIILWWLDSSYQLGGDSISPTDESEAFIKYKYGYHKTKYGNIYLKQKFGKDYLSLIAKGLVPYWIENSKLFDAHSISGAIKSFVEEDIVTIDGSEVDFLFEDFWYACSYYLTAFQSETQKPRAKNLLRDSFCEFLESLGIDCEIEDRVISFDLGTGITRD